MLNRSALESGREYAKGSKAFKAQRIEAHPTTLNTTQKNGRAEQMSCTTNNDIQTLLIPDGPLVRFWEECPYSACNECSPVDRLGCTWRPGEVEMA